MKKGAIFDMDGLMFDTEALYEIGWFEAQEHYGQQRDPGLHRFVCGTNGEVMYNLIREYYKGIEIDAVGVKEYAFGRVDEMSETMLEKKPGLVELLEGLKELGFKIAVASSSHTDQIERNLANQQVEKYFDVIVSNDMVAKSKPEPDIFLLAADKLGLAPEECYVFEDSPNGVRAGFASGCATIMIPDMIQPDDKLKAMTAGVFKDLNEALINIRAERV